MNRRWIALLKLTVLVGVVIVLCLIFPAAFRFVEMAAREARYFWWMILLLALAVWLIWGLGRKPKK
jgi:hypothetical protein